MPVTYFTSEKEPVIVTGKVTGIETRSSEGNGIQGVEIKASAKDTDVRYETVTDTDGSFSLPIIQTDKEYTISAYHPLYKAPEPRDVDFTNPVHDFLLEMVATGIEEILEEGDEATEAVFYNLQGVRIEKPANGVYLRISGDKKEKLFIK